jgi:thiamine phosphate synthase YjbQ (UPF0047 family)
MSHQQSFDIRSRGRGTTEITAEVARIVRAAGVATGVAQVFVQHTSCSVMITENADPAVRRVVVTVLG